MTKDKIPATAWFAAGQEEEKAKVVQKVTGACFSRAMNIQPKIRPAKEKTHVYMGGLMDLYDKDPEVSTQKMYDSLVEWWKPEDKELDFNGCFYTSVGTTIGKQVANALHRSGITWNPEDTDRNEDYQEFKIVSKLGINGYVDVLVVLEKLLSLGSKDGKLLPEKDEDGEYIWKSQTIRPLEVKSTGTYNYKKWKTWQDLPLEYRSQLSIYCHLLHELEIIDKPEGAFVIIQRDSPTCRVIWYEVEDELVKDGLGAVKRFWDHIQNKTFPEIDTEDEIPDAKKWIDEQINNQPDRQWPEIAKIIKE